jgi:hypothetical protein
MDPVVPYDKPYGPDSLGALPDNARFRPLPNGAGL